jgi:hypothetical protein
MNELTDQAVLDALEREFAHIRKTQAVSATAIPAARATLATIEQFKGMAPPSNMRYLDDLIETLAVTEEWAYTREAKDNFILYCFFGRGGHFEKFDRHVIGRVLIKPDRVSFTRRLEFSKSRPDVKLDNEKRGLDPALADHPGVDPDGLGWPEEAAMLDANVSLAADRQFEVIKGKITQKINEAREAGKFTAVQDAQPGAGAAVHVRREPTDLPGQSSLIKWKKVWRDIRKDVESDGKNAHEIAKMLEANQTRSDKLRGCPQGADTLKKIIKAGLAGRLD